MLSDVQCANKSSIEGTKTKIWCKQTGYEDYRTYVKQMCFFRVSVNKGRNRGGETAFLKFRQTRNKKEIV